MRLRKSRHVALYLVDGRTKWIPSPTKIINEDQAKPCRFPFTENNGRGRCTQFASFVIGYFGKYHNTLFLSPQILHKHCFQFLLGLTMVPRENKNNAYAKFWGTSKEYYGIFRNDLFPRWHHSWSLHWACRGVFKDWAISSYFWSYFQPTIRFRIIRFTISLHMKSLKLA